MRAFVLSVCLLLVSPARAVELHVCKLPSSALHGQIADFAHGDAVRWTKVDGDDARKVVAFINSVPPVSSYLGDYVDIATFPDQSVSMFFVSKKCVTFGQGFSGDNFVKLMTAALGGQS